MRLFTTAPKLPRWTRFLHPRFRGQVERPEHYELNDVVTESPRCWWAFPPFVRHRLAPRYPEAVARFAANAMRSDLLQAIERYQPDTLIGHGIMPWGRLLQSVSKDTGIPFSIIEHSAGDVMRLEKGTKLEQHYTDVATDADRVFVVGTWMHSHLLRLGWDNVSQVPNGTTLASDVQLHRPRPHDLRNRTLVLSAANYDRRKGFEELIEGFRRVHGDHPESMLVLITNAPAALRQQVADAGLGDMIRVLPRMSQDALMQWMVWADLFAMPSWSEAFGLVYVEALACRSPVLMTADCGLAPQLGLVMSDPEVDQHGWFVEPRSPDSVERALRDALSDRGRLAAMGQFGRAFVEHRFTWHENAKHLLAGLGDGRFCLTPVPGSPQALPQPNAPIRRSKEAPCP